MVVAGHDTTNTFKTLPWKTLAIFEIGLFLLAEKEKIFIFYIVTSVHAIFILHKKNTLVAMVTRPRNRKKLKN